MPYDPRPALSMIANGVSVPDAWAELWNELHHQGDVGEASYAAVTALVDLHSDDSSLDWNLFALCTTIEVERHRRGNPALPEWLQDDYQTAWQRLGELALNTLRGNVDSEMLHSSIAVVAIARGDLKLGAMINWSDSSELEEFLEEHMSWKECYGERAS